ncbi:Iron-sulfur cluster assembly protein SufD [Microcystis aeruginosa NIES-2549]|uniref:Iron-sulfur cluster assembly protein SufD n=1 Tax=Microcystis aeruginosa NIES-2549 TaxID=1641812 RepID=A0A0F6U803_MICAE|nr:Iron-sulfur cluster assembly protein SufD [Microcystis aeruginosa NIES-2549]AOC54864.1 Iron-sulfur cluster assembly protein SufD [Microcystis aeruginosa NIES-2481]
MKKFSPPEMKEISFPTPHTLHPTPYTPLPHLLNCVSKYSKRL